MKTSFAKVSDLSNVSNRVQICHDYVCNQPQHELKHFSSSIHFKSLYNFTEGQLFSHLCIFNYSNLRSCERARAEQ